MKKFLLLVWMGVTVNVLSCLGACVEEDGYRALVVKLMQTGVAAVGDAEQTDALYKQLALAKLGAPAEGGGEAARYEAVGKAEELCARYVKEQMAEDMADILCPYYKKYVSEQDLRGYLDFMQHNEMVVNTAKMVQGISGKMMEDLLTSLKQALIRIQAGETPENLQPARCSAEYEGLFNTYYARSGAQEMVDQLFGQMKGMSVGKVSEEEKRILDVYFDYIKVNMPILVRNFCVETLTEDDLRMYLSLTELPAYSGVMKATQELVANPLALFQAMQGNFDRWYEKQQ